MQVLHRAIGRNTSGCQLRRPGSTRCHHHVGWQPGGLAPVFGLDSLIFFLSRTLANVLPPLSQNGR